MKLIRVLTVISFIAAVVAVAPEALAGCDTCTSPCGSQDQYQCCYGCGYLQDGFSECRNVRNCGGCAGWGCIDVLRTEPEERGEPFHQLYRLAAVTIENRAAAKQPNVQLAAARRDPLPAAAH